MSTLYVLMYMKVLPYHMMCNWYTVYWFILEVEIVSELIQNT